MVFYLRDECCGHEAKLYFGKKYFGNVIFRKSCQKKVNVRVGNRFAGSRITCVCALRFMYCWAEEITFLKRLRTLLNICGDTAVDWNNYTREICILSMKSRDVKTDGPGEIVEIHECLFT